MASACATITRGDKDTLIIETDPVNANATGVPSVWYDSGKATVGTIDVRLSPGRYFLVFSNTFSMFANKVVTADLWLHYEHLKQS